MDDYHPGSNKLELEDELDFKRGEGWHKRLLRLVGFDMLAGPRHVQNSSGSGKQPLLDEYLEDYLKESSTL